jgi:hypothetical protein
MRLTTTPALALSLALAINVSEVLNPPNLLDPPAWLPYIVDHAMGRRCIRVCAKRMRGGPCFRYDRMCIERVEE